ncbi:NAD(P)/FAD-dependent oxidoreductase [Inediibacterium massiliense]|uniref:NAD(P)/FAD-dependent oxidoreductase n=1 Tax=Inediibacterium massiliense TaxID=1658111 RepID=UPI0006B672B4|nr:NAD(P)/FAD-dependent oxidoreductase [Inediibacterium massiliense]
MKDLLEKGAVLQRDKDTYAIAPHIPGGIVSSDTLRKIADVADKYNAQALKLTSAQRIAIVGLKEEDLDHAWNDLNMKPGAAIGLCVRSVKFCPGTTFCKRGQQDSVGVGMKLDDLYHGMSLPNKLKIGVSGCPNSCAENHFRDIGIMGMPKGFTIEVGGKGGVKPRIGDVLYENVDEEEIFPIIDTIVKVYSENANKHERLGAYIDRVGLEQFKAQVENEKNCMV